MVKPLRSNFAWVFAGSTVYAGCQWGMLSVLAKLGNRTIIGQFTLGLAVAAPLFMFTNLQLRAVQATDTGAEHGFANYFTLRLIATLLGLAAVLAVTPLAAGSFTARAVILTVALSKAVESMSDLTAGLLQREERLHQVAISLMLRGGLSVLFFSISFAYYRNLFLSAAVLSGVWLAVLFFYDLPRVRAVIGVGAAMLRFDPGELRRLVALGLPLGWVATLASLNVNIPRYFLEHSRGVAEQGVYASLAYLVVAINLVVFALTQSVTTRLARCFAMGNRQQALRLIARLSMLGGLIVVAGVPLTFLGGGRLLAWLYRPEYADHVGLLALFVGAAGVSTVSSFLYCGLTAARQFRAQIPAHLATTAAVTAGSALLVPRWGAMGAGWALLLSTLLAALTGFWTMRRVLRSGAGAL